MVVDIDYIDPIRRYKVVTLDGRFKIVKRRRSSMQGFVDMGIAAEALPMGNSLYSCEDMIYGGFRFDPDCDNIVDNLRAYPALKRIYVLIRSGQFIPPEF